MPLLDATAAALTILTDSIAGPNSLAYVDPTIGSAFSFTAWPSVRQFIAALFLVLLACLHQDVAW